MTSKEALEIIIFRLTSHEEDLELRETDKKVIEIIKQDLERLEALKKENVELRQEVSALEDYSYDVDCEKEFLIKENEKLKKALEKACKILSWDCPCDQDLINDLDCEDRCQPNIDCTECWKKYFLKEVVNNESNNT